jgi:cytochrome b subunit of formate dehydrogenase
MGDMAIPGAFPDPSTCTDFDPPGFLPVTNCETSMCGAIRVIASSAIRQSLKLIALGACLSLLSINNARADDPDNCLLCHQYRGLSRIEEPGGHLRVFYVDPSYSLAHRGPHARLACTACHARAEVGVVPHGVVTPVDCARQCHLSDRTGLERSFSHDNVAAMLQRSAHAEEAFAKLRLDGGAVLARGQSNCLYCHDEPTFRDPSLVIPKFKQLAGQAFDRCETCHAEKIDADIRYFTNHIASRLQPARSPLELAQVCAVCHSNPRMVAEHENKDPVASFMRSFHGKAALLGDESTANCLSCHVRAGENVHLMLGPADPNSAIHPANVANACRSVTCHPGADKQIAASSVHLDISSDRGTLEFALAAVFILVTLLTFGPSALLVILDLVQVVVGRHVHDDARVRKLVHRINSDARGPARLVRFSVSQRFQHWALAILFILLVLTGFPLKFADRGWATVLVSLFGGLQYARNIHHWSGIALVVGFMIHLGSVCVGVVKTARAMTSDTGLTAYKKAWVALPMWITPQDVRKTIDSLRYLLFLSKERPAYGRFSPTEKFEYLGVFWGTMLLGITGLLLWGEQISSHFLSGRILNLATIAHTYEAFLAVIHVGILHIYNVIFSPKVFPLSTATLGGRTPVEKLVEEHGELIEGVARDLGIAGEDVPQHG